MDKTITISPYSMASYYVDVFFNDIKLSNATCFFTKRKDTLYLVTNWHVVSGRNADSKICLDKMGSVPNKLRVYVPREGENSTVSYDDDFYMDIDLLDQEGNKLWYEMQKDDRMVDVAVVPLHEVKGAYND